MAEKFVDPVANTENTSRINMMEMWRESVTQAKLRRQTVNDAAPEANNEKTDLEQRIRNGEIACPTCAARQYQDSSGDTSVSFQAPKHISAATSGLAVMSHEAEHVSHEAADAREKGGEVVQKSVSLQYARCPTCGKTYVAGGTTKTVTVTPSARTYPGSNPFRRFDARG
jgi:transposase-like protein